MIYSALCLDTSAYFEKGTIKVRIFEYYTLPRRVFDGGNGGSKMIIDKEIDDLSKTPTELTVGDKASLHNDAGTSADFEAIIFAPLGGGRNYGMFSLPKTNEKGIVAFLDSSKPVWLGSYFEPLYKKGGDKSLDFTKVAFVNAPNEDPETEGADSDLAKDGDSNTTLSEVLAGDQNTIILRTKTTIPNASSGDDMNFEKQATENLIAIDSKKVRIRHFTGSEALDDGKANDKYQEVLIYKDEDNENKETIKLEINNTTDTKQSYVKITEDGFDFYTNKNGEETIFKLGVSAGDNEEDGGGDGSTLFFKDKDDNTIIGKGGNLLINGKDESVVLYSDLKDILEQLMEHIHIGVVPTKGPLTTKKAPLQYKKQMTEMEATLIKSKHK